MLSIFLDRDSTKKIYRSYYAYKTSFLLLLYDFQFRNVSMKKKIEAIKDYMTNLEQLDTKNVRYLLARLQRIATVAKQLTSISEASGTKIDHDNFALNILDLLNKIYSQCELEKHKKLLASSFQLYFEIMENILKSNIRNTKLLNYQQFFFVDPEQIQSGREIMHEAFNSILLNSQLELSDYDLLKLTKLLRLAVLI